MDWLLVIFMVSSPGEPVTAREVGHIVTEDACNAIGRAVGMSVTNENPFAAVARSCTKLGARL